MPSPFFMFDLIRIPDYLLAFSSLPPDFQRSVGFLGYVDQVFRRHCFQRVSRRLALR